MVESEVEDPLLATFVVFIIYIKIGGNMNMNIKTQQRGHQNTQQLNHPWQDHNGKIMIGRRITVTHCKTPLTEDKLTNTFASGENMTGDSPTARTCWRHIGGSQ